MGDVKGNGTKINTIFDWLAFGSMWMPWTKLIILK